MKLQNKLTRVQLLTEKLLFMHDNKVGAILKGLQHFRFIFVIQLVPHDSNSTNFPMRIRDIRDIRARSCSSRPMQQSRYCFILCHNGIPGINGLWNFHGYLNRT